ncbi:hypothetical protein JD844_026018 [Phrynosoma platyrhinos]|uniref:Ankyrin repeat domain-containing protein 53 n=1 Tax=Phrynosoma platyrhinos TaxID=52577 RepID=A0ABQ7SEL5_PHRPL|nr:hypothetical protein JD844_026018 [Phrynosoma platyrhinos]
MGSPKGGRRSRHRRHPNRISRVGTASAGSFSGEGRRPVRVGGPGGKGSAPKHAARVNAAPVSSKSIRQSSAKIKSKEIHYAASTGHVRWLQVCLQKTASPTQADINGFSALHTAALRGRLDCIQMLVDRYGANVNLASVTGWRPIHLVLSKENGAMALECLKYLISKGAKVNVKNQSGITPLHKAANIGNEKCARVLIEAGADVHAKDKEGQKPIDLFLASAMWKTDKENYAREMCRLNEIKMECEMRRKEFLKREQVRSIKSWLKAFKAPSLVILVTGTSSQSQPWSTPEITGENEIYVCSRKPFRYGTELERKQGKILSEHFNVGQMLMDQTPKCTPYSASLFLLQMEVDFCNAAAFEEWLAKKHLSRPSSRIATFLEKRRLSVSLRKFCKGIVSPVTSVIKLVPDDISHMLQKDQRQQRWNPSTNVSSKPATRIFRPSIVRLGVDPEKVVDPDFTSFVFLFKNALGEMEIQINGMDKVPFVPYLPLEDMEKRLYPQSWPPRMEVPKDFHPPDIYNLKHKRHPGPEHKWTDQMAMSLRQTFDPAFVGRLKAHFSTYGDPKVLSPRLDSGCTRGKETFPSSSPSSSSSSSLFSKISSRQD